MRSMQAGVTLAEALVVLAIIGILLAGGAQAVESYGRTTNLNAYINRLHMGALLTRSEAIKRNTRVVMCRSMDGQTCTVSGSWREGWIVFADTDNNAQRTLGEELLLHDPGLPIRWNATGNTPVVAYISYTGRGSTQLVSGAFQAGTITVCQQSSTSTTAAQLVISSTGRPRTQRVALLSC
jgi:type IV fimbrial biogenesis protein FimT